MSDALQAALLAVAAAENAAVYGYSLAGARLETSREKSVARAAYDVHRAQVQAASGWLADRDATPAPPAAIYDLPTPVADATSARATLAAIEESTAAAYADLVSVCDGALQRAAALALQSAAVREAQWRTTSVPFPGLVGRVSG
jgi:hypothetical protein